MSSSYQNYDFGANWNEKIVPILLNDYRIQEILRAHESEEKYYKASQPPVYLSSYGCFSTLYDKVFEHEETKRTDPRVSHALWVEYDRLEALYIDHDDDDYDEKREEYNDDVVDQKYKQRDVIMDAMGWDWKTNKTLLAHYVPFGRCHDWNRRFCYYLALILFPNLKWEIMTSKEHTTVICKKTKQIFDILYWGLDERLEDYTFNRPYTNEDKSLGGNRAFEDASKKKRKRKRRVK